MEGRLLSSGEPSLELLALFPLTVRSEGWGTRVGEPVGVCLGGNPSKPSVISYPTKTSSARMPHMSKLCLPLQFFGLS
jgi:hypothetical protein